MSKATAKKTPGTPSTPRATAKKASGKAAPPADASAPAARPRSLTTQAYERIEAS